jgi:hypothetical protein
VQWVYRFALCREPTADELTAARDLLSEKPAAESLSDMLWAVMMLPEFQFVR